MFHQIPLAGNWRRLPKCKLIFVFICLVFPAGYAFSQPQITSFTPTSGAVGSTVTISGNNFSASPANNIVFFGAVKANVSASSAGSLSVTVPPGATYQPISVSVAGLTAYSATPFITTFPNGLSFQQGPTNNQYVFGQETDFATGLRPNGIAAADFDGDGKIDLVTSNNFSTNNSASLSVLRNLSIPGKVNFAASQNLNIGGLAFCIAAGDLDGDGKPDIVAASIDSQLLYVFKNTSTPGKISFSSPTTYATGTNPYCIAIADLDGDGRPEVISANYLSGSFSVFQNTTTNGQLRFASKVDFTTGLGPRGIAVADMNGDGKVDLAIVDELSNTLQIFPNTSVNGQISFSAAATYATGSNPYGVAAGDLDGDGKPDIAVANYQSYTLSVYRNTGSGSAFSLAPKTDYPGGFYPTGVCIGDLNGDGKPDVVMVSSNTDLYQNTSTTGTITLTANVYLDAVQFADLGVLADLDLDGKSDLALSNLTGEASVLRNIDNEPSVQSFSPSSAPAGGSVTIKGVNFASANAVTFGGIPATSFTVTNDSTINAVVATGNSGNVTVVNTYGTGSTSGFIFQGPPTITGFTPVSAGAGDSVTITGINFPGATIVSLGGVPALSFTVTSPTTITAIVGSGASGQVSVGTPYGSGALGGFILIPPPQIDAISPDSAILGATVTISGQYFTTATAVTFGGIPAASFSVVSDATIQAVVANGASGDVNVISVGGTGVFPGFVFLPPPSITAVSPDSGASGTKIVLTGNYFGNVSAVSFGGVPASSFYYQSPTQIVAIPGAGASGNITVTTPYGPGQWTGFTFTSSPAINSFTPVSGGKNAIVTITGTHLDSVTAVSFGGAPAQSFTILSPDSLSAVVGEGASGNVTVSTPYASASLDGFLFAGSPVITSISPANAGPGTVITISGSNFTGTENVLLGGVSAVSYIVINASTIQAVVGTSAGNDSVVLTNLYGSTSSAGFSFNAQRPSITAISPVSGEPGSRVTITGANFSPSAAGNIVFFGAVRATSITATANAIIATIPVGATYAPVTVTTGGLTAASSNFFLPVFSANDSAFTVSSFQPTSWELGAGDGDYVAISDLNNDGKPDLVVADHELNGTGTVTEENSSTPGNVQFPAAGINNRIANDPFSAAVADFDGDGKPDIVSANQGSNTVSVSRNTIQNGGGLYFLDSTSYPCGATPTVVAAADMDGDGKPDIVVVNYASGTVSILRNNSVIGNIAFLPKYDLNAPGSPYGLALADLNGDGKPDIAVTSSASAAVVSIFLNTSTPGALSFGNRLDISAGSILTGVAIGDLDGDGKPDIAAASLYGPLTILLNTGSNGSISFAKPFTVPLSYGGTVVAIGDLDGDGKPDVVVGNGENSTFTISKNKSLPGIPYFAAGVIIPSSYNVNGVAIGDIDGDGKPDIVTSNNMDILNVFVNMIPTVPLAPPTVTSFTPDTAYFGTPVTITGANLDRVSSVTFGGTPAASFVINSATSITAVVDSGGTGSVSVSNGIDTASLNGFVFLNRQAPTITAFTPTSAKPGGTVTITGTNFVGVAAVEFGERLAATFTVVSPTTIVAVIGSGTSGNVTVLTTNGTASLSGFVFVGANSTTSSWPTITSFSPASGSQGTTITIEGSGLGNVNAVSFGGVASASFSIVSDSLIKAVVGGGASGDVSVTNDSGSVSLPGFTFINGNGAGASDSLYAYPNPAKDQVTIIYPNSTSTAALLVIDAKGDVLKTIILPPGNTQTTIALMGFAKGIYLIEWISGTSRKTQTVLVM
jgi:hypothetical protein